MTMSAYDRDRRRPPTIDTILPWTCRNISIRPFGSGWWSFNPSVHHDPASQVWRCVYRCANYSLPDGVVQLSKEAHHGKARSRSVIAILDPATWSVISLDEVRDIDHEGPPRIQGCSSLGLEDMRLFRTQRDGLIGVATSLEYNADHPSWPEMVLCRFRDPDRHIRSSSWRSTHEQDGAYDVVSVTPMRGAWSCRPQKNWSPFDDATVPRFLYSIERGVVMSDVGIVDGSPSPMGTRPSANTRTAHVGKNGVEVKLLVNPTHPPAQTVIPTNNTGSTELRGGSQLIAIEDDVWLGIAHEMTTAQPNRRKLYWHTFYTVDGAGRMIRRSAPFKLSTHDIEFAAGMAIHGGRVMISYGTDDHDAWIGIASLRNVMNLLQPAKVDETTKATQRSPGLVEEG
jgi:hypothetical protein